MGFTQKRIETHRWKCDRCVCVLQNSMGVYNGEYPKPPERWTDFSGSHCTMPDPIYMDVEVLCDKCSKECAVLHESFKQQEREWYEKFNPRQLTQGE